MLARNGEPATAGGDRQGGRKIVGCGKPASSKPHPQNSQAIRAELAGSDRCTALGITAAGTAPVLALCRQLLAAGLDPDQAMEVYRGATLALRVRSIGEAAGLEINGKGTGFVRAADVGTASPMRFPGKNDAPPVDRENSEKSGAAGC